MLGCGDRGGPPVVGGLLPAGVLGTSSPCSTRTRASPPRVGRWTGQHAVAVASQRPVVEPLQPRERPAFCGCGGGSRDPVWSGTTRTALHCASKAISLCSGLFDGDPALMCAGPDTENGPAPNTSHNRGVPSSCKSRMFHETDCLAEVHNFTRNFAEHLSCGHSMVVDSGYQNVRMSHSRVGCRRRAEVSSSSELPKSDTESLSDSFRSSGGTGPGRLDGAATWLLPAWAAHR